MCPGLPGDPPGPEMLGALSLVVLALSLAIVMGVTGLSRLRGKPLRGPRLGALCIATLLALSAAWLASCSLLNIRARNVGRWGDLKHELIALTKRAEAFEATHGRITSPSQAESFYEFERRAGSDLNFSFGPQGPDVHLVYRWWAQPARAMIVWGHGRSAGFDLETMECDAYD